MLGYGNGQPPVGYRAPVRQALTRRHIVGKVPRELGGIVLMLCIGLGLLLDSWGAAGVFFLLYGGMVYLTKKDPWWPHVWRDYLLLWMALHPAEARWLKAAAVSVVVAVIIGILAW
jgi:type IV secretory pathway TrbD component